MLFRSDSTNDEALRQLAAGRPTPFAVLARRQTKGRGRFGRTWHSESPDSLYASFAFRPEADPARMQTFTLWMGVNVCELIHNLGGVSPSLKWPNDLLFQGRKAGGMLTEARPFNLMLKTYVGPTATEDDIAYLRPETAQAIFAQFKNTVDSTRVKVPFGIAQIGKAFRNEVTPRNYTFRSREFEQMELEFFIKPDEVIEAIHGSVDRKSTRLNSSHT